MISRATVGRAGREPAPPPRGPKNRWLSVIDREGFYAVHYGAEIIGHVWKDQMDDPPAVVYRALSPSLREVDHPHADAKGAAAAVVSWHETWSTRWDHTNRKEHA